jgi:chromate reductase
MPTLIGISGSLRKGSYNSALLRAAVAHAPEGTQLEAGSIAGIPLYDGDLEEREGLPALVSALKERIAAADGLLLVTPEYNQSVPGVFKNAIDWLSRPAKDLPRVFGGKPVALIGATPGPAGTRLAQTAWLPVLRALGATPYLGKQLYVASAAQVFDADGNLVDAKTGERLADFLRGFSGFAAAIRAATR